MADLLERVTKVTAGSLEPGEAVSHGARCMPVGGHRRASLSGMGGLVGVLANSAIGPPAEHALAGSPLPHDVAVALTDRRILFVAVSTLTGRPNQVVGAIPLSELRSVDVAEATSLGVGLHRFTLVLDDGSALSLETRSRGGSAGELCAALVSAAGRGGRDRAPS